MSKLIENQNELKNSNSKPYGMSERQQLLYLMNKTQNNENIEDPDKVLLTDDYEYYYTDYHQYFLEKKEKAVPYFFYFRDPRCPER